MLIPINITGPSYKHRARSQSAQRTVGLFSELLDVQTGKSKYILNSFPGLKLFASAPGGKDRGIFEHKGNVYKVTGLNFSKIDKDGVYNSIGTISDSARCIFSGIGNDVIIVSGGNAYIYKVGTQDITDFNYSNLTLTIQHEPTALTGFTISDDGLNFYIVGQTDARVYQYSLSSPWNIETGGYANKSFSVSSQDSAPGDIIFGKSGHKFYMVGSFSGEKVYQYTLTTPWDISTASYDSISLDVTAEGTNPADAKFKYDGTICYVLVTSTNTIYQYTLTTPWDLSTASYASKSLNPTAQDAQCLCFELSSDGLVIYVAGNTNDTIYQYTMTTAWDISTASYASKSLNISSEATTARGLSFGNDNSVIYVLNQIGKKIYQYSPLKQITDADLESPNSCAHLNNQMIYDGDGGRFCTSDVGDATSINGLNYATAESEADNLLRVYVFNQVLYLFGEKSTETWYNSGVGNPPFDRIEGGILPVGIGAIHSAANNDKYLYFFADDRRVYRIPGKENISTIALSQEFDAYLTVEDAIGFCFTFDNQDFYMLIFPAQDKSWCFSETTGWFEPNKNRYIGNSHAYAYGKNLIADHDNGNIYELDPDTYDENGTNVERFRDTAPLSGELLNAPGKRITLNRFELIMEVGVGRLPSTDNRENPYCMLSISRDGGKTFGTERWKTLGKQGQYHKVEWHALGSFQEAVIRVKFSDPNYYSIHSANAEIEIGI